MFELHPRLRADTRPVAEWPLSSVRLMDDTRFPWLILIPRVDDAREIHLLAPDQRSALLDEVVRASEGLERATGAFKLNVAALGNVVPQLHVHVIARHEGDAAWPGPVWGVPGRTPYADADAARWIERFRSAVRFPAAGGRADRPR